MVNCCRFVIDMFTLNVSIIIRREDDRLQATGAELGDSIFNMTGEKKDFAFIHDTFLYSIHSSVSAQGHL